MAYKGGKLKGQRKVTRQNVCEKGEKVRTVSTSGVALKWNKFIIFREAAGRKWFRPKCRALQLQQHRKALTYWINKTLHRDTAHFSVATTLQLCKTLISPSSENHVYRISGLTLSYGRYLKVSSESFLSLRSPTRMSCSGSS